VPFFPSKERADFELAWASFRRVIDVIARENQLEFLGCSLLKRSPGHFLFLLENPSRKRDVTSAQTAI